MNSKFQIPIGKLKAKWNEIFLPVSLLTFENKGTYPKRNGSIILPGMVHKVHAQVEEKMISKQMIQGTMELD